MWGFFQEDGRGTPLAALGSDRRFICGMLGLPLGAADEEVVCFEYVLPPSIPAKIPRVVEAYATGPWNSFFQTQQEADVSRGHGRTRVWDLLREKEKRGLPEVIHKPVTGDLLVSVPVVY
jgi:hypothetical protein